MVSLRSVRRFFALVTPIAGIVVGAPTTECVCGLDGKSEVAELERPQLSYKEERISGEPLGCKLSDDPCDVW